MALGGGGGHKLYVIVNACCYSYLSVLPLVFMGPGQLMPLNHSLALWLTHNHRERSLRVDVELRQIFLGTPSKAAFYGPHSPSIH